MKNHYPFLILAAFCLTGVLNVNAQTGIIQGVQGNDSGTTVIQNRKGNAGFSTQYEIITATTDIVGEAGSGQKDSYANWKAACAEWKADVKNLKSGDLISPPTCGRPTKEVDPNQAGYSFQKSTGSYQIRVKTAEPKFN